MSNTPNVYELSKKDWFERCQHKEVDIVLNYIKAGQSCCYCYDLRKKITDYPFTSPRMFAEYARDILLSNVDRYGNVKISLYGNNIYFDPKQKELSFDILELTEGQWIEREIEKRIRSLLRTVKESRDSYETTNSDLKKSLMFDSIGFWPFVTAIEAAQYIGTVIKKSGERFSDIKVLAYGDHLIFEKTKKNPPVIEDKPKRKTTPRAKKTKPAE